MTQNEMVEFVTRQEVLIEQMVKTQNTLAEELKNTNKKIDSLAEVFAKHEVITTEIKHIERRIMQLEQLRWWFGSTIVLAVIGAVLKLVIFNGKGV